jgi:3-deoxy-D-manno-octulosonate 8-phosphate phosphatase (KDO 8-P phosphatase)
VKSIAANIRKKAQKIKLLLLDVDGVLTDGGIFIDDRGVESKRFDVRDGQGITLLRNSGIEVGFITGRNSNIVRYRAKELGVRILHQGVKNKGDIYKRIKIQKRLNDEQIAYLGDDLADLPILRKVGLAAAVRDSWEGIKTAAHYVTQAKGGRGAVREVAELLLLAQNIKSRLIK